jgi:Fur family ferric uptake transcriptional regulator
MDDAATKLARVGHRITGPRLEVLGALRQFSGPFTVEELSAAAPGVGRATVFRTIKLLHEADVVCRMVLEDGAVRYEVSRGEHHHHLICSECGGITEFFDPAVDALIAENAASRGFELAGHSLELYGQCAACRTRSPAEGSAA